VCVHVYLFLCVCVCDCVGVWREIVHKLQSLQDRVAYWRLREELWFKSKG
jgi:hypothetical protein